MWSSIFTAFSDAFNWVWNWISNWQIEGVYVIGIFVIVFVMGLALRFLIMPLMSGVKGAASDTVRLHKNNNNHNSYNRDNRSGGNYQS